MEYRYRTLDIDLLSARELKNVNLFDKMAVYAVFSISGSRDANHNEKIKSTADHDGGSSPTWNFPMKFIVEEEALQNNRLTLDIKLVCARALGDKGVGKVHVRIKDLLDSRPPKSSADGKQRVSYQVRKPNGKPKGELTISYRFSDIATGSPAAVALQYGSAVPSAPPMGNFCTAHVPAYQAGQIPNYPQPGASYLYPAGNCHYPPPPGYGYAATPPPRYAYEAASPAMYGYPATPPPGYWYQAQAQPGYGYQAAPPPPPRKSKLGLGLGAGLVAGTIGGLALWC